MSVHVIKMPDIGEGIAEVELVAWHVKPGDSVTEDQVLADVMTDKATVEIPSPVAGTVQALGGQVGQVMAVGSELIRIDMARKSAAPAPEARQDRAPPATPPLAPSASPAVAPDMAAVAPGGAGAAPRVGAAAAPGGARSAASAPHPPAPHPHETATLDPAARPLASPAVRQRARQLGIDLRELAGQGPGQRITHADLDARLLQQAAPQQPPARPPAGQPPAAAPPDDVEAVAVIGLRRKIAQQMQESKRRIPHFTYVEEVDVTELEALRAQLNTQWSATRGRLTVLPLLARALVLALREFPQINARYDDEGGVVTRYGAVHLGIATQTAAGLLVPVVRHAEALDLWACAAEITRLAEATRSNSAKRDELSGATITITSLGALGGIVSTPVINHPEVAIVGVNRIVERPMMQRGAVVARLMMNLSSSFDHRVVDGADAAAFIQAVRRLLECPALLFVE
jgi:2-oxoisovalerate dehydrogenase E2 component (dihydrolipoyl transacylase)